MPQKSKGPSTPDVQVRSLTDIANEAVNANIGNLPKLLEAFSQYGPQYAQLINQIYTDANKSFKDTNPMQYNVLDPLSKGIASNLNFINDSQNEGIPQPLLNSQRNRLRSAQAARGIAESPAAAFSEANALAPIGEQYRENVTDEALRFLSLPPGSTTTPGAMQNFSTLGLDPISSSTLFGGGLELEPMRVNNAYDQYALQQQSYNNQQQKNKDLMKLIGTGVGAVGGFAVGGPAGAAYGASAGNQAGGTFF